MIEIQRDEHETIAVFRRYPDGWTIALFPEDEDATGRCGAYGQDDFHCGVCYDDVIAATEPATAEESAAMCAKLEESWGYRLDTRQIYTLKGR